MTENHHPLTMSTQLRHFLLILLVFVHSNALAQPQTLSVDDRIKLATAMSDCIKNSLSTATSGGLSAKAGFTHSASAKVDALSKKLIGGEANFDTSTAAEFGARFSKTFAAIQDAGVQGKVVDYCRDAAIGGLINATASSVPPPKLVMQAQGTKPSARKPVQPTNGETLRKCSENEKCNGEAMHCALAGDDLDGDAGMLANNTSDTPVSYGGWYNTECKTSGTGWHVKWGSCGANQGTRFKRCQFVLVKPRRN